MAKIVRCKHGLMHQTCNLCKEFDKETVIKEADLHRDLEKKATK